MLKELIIKNRSTRVYHQSLPVSREVLLDLVDLARLSPSGGNRQLLRYYLCSEPKLNETIYSHISLGGNPAPGERPAAYIIILNDTKLGTYGPIEVDHGIVAQSILLGAAEKGLGGCIIGMVNRKELKKALYIPDRYEILLVISLGWPKEKFVFEEIEPNTDNVRGWWDAQGVRHIPKRKLQDIIIG
jgi:nitroreductase